CSQELLATCRVADKETGGTCSTLRMHSLYSHNSERKTRAGQVWNWPSRPMNWPDRLRREGAAGFVAPTASRVVDDSEEWSHDYAMPGSHAHDSRITRSTLSVSRVLVVDDDDAVRTFVKRILDEEG